MEPVIVVLNTLSLLCFSASLIVINFGSGRAGIPVDSKIIVSLICCIFVFVNLSNILEHLGIGPDLDYYEDFVELLVPLFFIGFLNALRLHVDIARRRRNEEQLDAMLRERNALLKEIHHRVKNNLQVVLSILDLRRRQRDVDAKTDKVLMATESRIFSMAAVHEVIYTFEHSRTIPVAEFTRTIVGRASRQTSAGRRGTVNVLFDINPEVNLSLEKAVPFGMLVNELVSNAFRCSFPGEQNGEVIVNLSQTGDEVTLEVTASGEEPPEKAATDEETALSLTLIENLTHQLEGTSKVPAGDGSRVIVQFPP